MNRTKYLTYLITKYGQKLANYCKSMPLQKKCMFEKRILEHALKHHNKEAYHG